MTADATQPTTNERSHAGVLSGLLAAAALFLGLLALVYHPIPLAIAATLLGLVAAAMSPRHQVLAAFSLAAAAIGFVGGCTIAIVTGNPLW